MTTPKLSAVLFILTLALAVSGCGVSDRMNSMDQQMQTITTQMKEINSQLKQTNQQLGTTNQSLNGMNKSVSAMGEGFKSVAADLQKLGASAQYLSAIGQIAASMTKLGAFADSAQPLMAALGAVKPTSPTPIPTPTLSSTPVIEEDDVSDLVKKPGAGTSI